MGVFATTKPAGSVSEKARPFSDAGLPPGLPRVKVSVEVSNRLTVDGEKLFEIVGGASTARVAVLLVAPAPLSFELITPVVLDLFPWLLAAIFTPMVHMVLAASVPPVKVRVVFPGLGANVPPQVFDAPVGEATIRPAGRLSLNWIPVKL